MGIYYDYSNSLDPLNEVYIGKKASLLEMEKVIHELRSPYLRKNGNNYSGAISAVRDKNLLLLEKLIEEEFGFKNLYLTISNKPYMNAWTHPIDFYLDSSMNMQNLVVTSSKGYRFKPEAKVSTDIAITSKLLFDPSFTDGEILAILLHEIGHNFESVMNQNLCTFSQLYSFLIFMTGLSGQITNLLYTSNTIKDFENNIKRFIVRSNGVGTLVGFGSMISASVTKILVELEGVINIVTLGTGKLAIMALNTANRFFNPAQFILDFIYSIPGKGKENLADSFCYIYGYGEEQISALSKMDSKEMSDIETQFNNVPILASIKDIFSYPATLLAYFLDPHPLVVKRCKNIINDCKYDIEHEEDPRVRKELIEQMKKLEKAQNDYFVQCKNVNDNLIVKKTVLKCLASTDYKENIYSSTRDMDYQFQKLKNENKHNINFI